MSTEDGKCEFLDTCGFFLHFTSNLEVIKKGWIRLYCENRDNAALCERRKFRLQTGKPPRDNMSPIGTLM